MVLIVDKLKKVYGEIPAVDAISFALVREILKSASGPNGSGKTTTIQMLLGTLTPTSGTIILERIF